MAYKFSAGQVVEYIPAGSVAGRYGIVRAMPEESHYSEPRYRIKGELGGEERVVSESSLSDNVGTAEDYAEAAALALAAQRPRK